MQTRLCVSEKAIESLRIHCAHCIMAHRLPLGFGIPLMPHAAHHHTAEGPLGTDAALQRQIKQSQRVGTLLLKAEDEELAAVQQRADELMKQYR